MNIIHKLQQITAIKTDHCFLSVCLYPLLGVLQLFVTPPPQHYFSKFPSPSLQQLSEACYFIPELLILHLLSAYLCALVQVGSGNVIQFNSVLNLCLKPLSICDSFYGVCHRFGKFRKSIILFPHASSIVTIIAVSGKWVPGCMDVHVCFQLQHLQNT